MRVRLLALFLLATGAPNLSGAGQATVQASPTAGADAARPAATLLSFGGKCDGSSDDSKAFAGAAAALAARGGTIAIAAGQTCVINSNAATSEGMALAFEAGGRVRVAAGKTLTINGPWSAGRYQIFEGPGTVQLGSVPRVIEPAWWGAKYDNTTDDAAALQAAIDAAGNLGPVLRTGSTVSITGPMAIGSTIVIARKSTTLDCGGIGAVSARAPFSNTIRWIGPADVPMIEVKDTMVGTVIRSCHIFGDPASPPRSAISYVNTEKGIGPSQQKLEDVWIGSMPGDGPYGPRAGPSVRDAIYIGDKYDGGGHGNNDTFVFNNVWVSACSGSALRQGSTQNVVIAVRTAQLKSCKYGVRVAGGLTLDNVFFSGSSEADIYVPLTDDWGQQVAPQVIGRVVSAEGSHRFISLDGSGTVDITGGYWQLGQYTAPDKKVILAENNSSQAISLHDYIFSTGGFQGPWIITMRSLSAGSVTKNLVLDGIRLVGAAAPTLDMESRGPSDQRFVCQRVEWVGPKSPPASVCNLIAGSGDTFNPARHDLPIETLRVGQRSAGHGAVEISESTQTLTLSGPRATAGGLIPANSLVLGVTAIAATNLTCTGCKAWRVGNSTSPAKWGSVPNLSIGQTTSLANWDLAAVGRAPYYTQAAEDVIVSPDSGSFTGGTVRVTAVFMKLVAPVKPN